MIKNTHLLLLLLVLLVGFTKAQQQYLEEEEELFNSLGEGEGETLGEGEENIPENNVPERDENDPCGLTQYFHPYEQTCKPCVEGCGLCMYNYCYGCSEGYILLNYVCYSCSIYGNEGCLECSDLYTCVTCDDGYELVNSQCQLIQAEGEGEESEGEEGEETEFIDTDEDEDGSGNEDGDGEQSQGEGEEFLPEGEEDSQPEGEEQGNEQEKCAVGSYFDVRYGICQDCPSNCDNCMYNHCYECADGHVLLNYVCWDCKIYGGEGCNSCSDLFTCSSCDTGYALIYGKCYKI